MSNKAPHQRALDVLIHRCGRWSRVRLSRGRTCMVYDIAWGFDEGTDIAHITSNISPGPGAEHKIDFFHATEIGRIEDPETGAVLFERNPSPFRLLMYVPVPWVFILTYLAGVGLEYAWPLPLAIEALPGVSVAGVVLFGIGAVMAGWGLLTFRRARTTTVPGKVSSQLVTWGPYRFSRNPMYVGLTLWYLGEAGILRQVWPVILLPLIAAYVNWVVIPVEEGKLEEIFGEKYERYRARVRRWV